MYHTLSSHVAYHLRCIPARPRVFAGSNLQFHAPQSAHHHVSHHIEQPYARRARMRKSSSSNMMSKKIVWRKACSGSIIGRLAAAPPAWTSYRVRKTFVDYFRAQGRDHTFWPSSPVIPSRSDTSLMFVNAGMNQFKPVFLGDVVPGSRLAGLRRVVNYQKCIRAGGKHNDLDDVGFDTYHHTFFEMLGTWSFGDYYKEEATAWAWELLVDVYGLNPAYIYATYFAGDTDLGLPADDEARALWLRFLPPERVIPGSLKDNFWEMGDTGPCGPCTEIHYDLSESLDASHMVNKDHPDVIEVWNLVFISHERVGATELRKLSACHVDTGMGMERLTTILQGKRSNYDTDVFQPIFDAIQKRTGAPSYSGSFSGDARGFRDTAYRVIADHVRALTVAIADGAIPGNEGTGYVLRRICRRASRYAAKAFGSSQSQLLASLVPVVVESMGAVYPEVAERANDVQTALAAEEKAFSAVVARGIRHFEDLTKNSTIIKADDIFFLYDSLGFPVDVTQQMAREAGISVDMDGFNRLMAEQKLRSKRVANDVVPHDPKNGQFKHNSTLTLTQDHVEQLVASRVPPTRDDLKYNTSSVCSTTLPCTVSEARSGYVTVCDSKVVALLHNGSLVSQVSLIDRFLEAGHSRQGRDFVDTSVDAKDEKTVFGVVLEATPFYSEAGGQIGDRGVLILNSSVSISQVSSIALKVIDVQRTGPYVLHTCVFENVDGKLQQSTDIQAVTVDSIASCVVDSEWRKAVSANHTMTHALGHSLRAELGPGVVQKGSHVDAKRLRFDFSSPGRLTEDQISRVAERLRDMVAANEQVYVGEAQIDHAMSITGVQAAFGEQYGDFVRIVSLGTPIEDLLANPGNEAWLSTSVELCGGTHLAALGDAAHVVVVEERGVATGVRRMVVVTGNEAARVLANTFKMDEQITEAESMGERLVESVLVSIKRELAETTLDATKAAGFKKRVQTLQKAVQRRIKARRAEAATEISARVTEAEQLMESHKSTSPVIVTFPTDHVDTPVLKLGMQLDSGYRTYPILAICPQGDGGLICFATVPTNKGIGTKVSADIWLSKILSPLGGRAGGRADAAQGKVPPSSGNISSETMIRNLSEAACVEYASLSSSNDTQSSKL